MYSNSTTVVFFVYNREGGRTIYRPKSTQIDIFGFLSVFQSYLSCTDGEDPADPPSSSRAYAGRGLNNISFPVVTAEVSSGATLIAGGGRVVVTPAADQSQTCYISLPAARGFIVVYGNTLEHAVTARALKKKPSLNGRALSVFWPPLFESTVFFHGMGLREIETQFYFKSLHL